MDETRKFRPNDEAKKIRRSPEQKEKRIFKEGDIVKLSNGRTGQLGPAFWGEDGNNQRIMKYHVTGEGFNTSVTFEDLEKNNPD